MFARQVNDFNVLNWQDQENVTHYSLQKHQSLLKYIACFTFFIASEEEYSNVIGNANINIFPARPCLAQAVNTSDWTRGGGQDGQQVEGDAHERVGQSASVLHFYVSKSSLKVGGRVCRLVTRYWGLATGALHTEYAIASLNY